MTRYLVRILCSNDLEALRPLAADHVVALVDGRSVSALPCFVRDRAAWCTMLAAHTESPRSRVTPLQVAVRVHTVMDGAHTIRARGRSAWPGATGDERNVSEVVQPVAVSA